MFKLASRRFAIALLSSLALALPAVADIDGHGPDAFEVTGVAANDVLNARMGPGTNYDIISHFQPGERGLQQVTCVPFLPQGAYMNLTSAQRDALPASWCLMRSADLTRTGWASARFLREQGERTPPAAGGTTDPAAGISGDAGPHTINNGDGGRMITVQVPESGLTFVLPPGWGASEPHFYETAAGVRASQPTISFYVNDRGQWRDVLWLNLRQFMGGECLDISAGSLCYRDEVGRGGAEYLAPMIQVDSGW